MKGVSNRGQVCRARAGCPGELCKSGIDPASRPGGKAMTPSEKWLVVEHLRELQSEAFVR
jgi:hypothetical protein